MRNEWLIAIGKTTGRIVDPAMRRLKPSSRGEGSYSFPA
jgi:hypothetical protein